MKNEYSVGIHQCDGCMNSLTDEESFDKGKEQEVYCEECILRGEHV